MTPEDKEALMRFIYYGGSVEFFFVIFTAFLIAHRCRSLAQFGHVGSVRVLEGLANTRGRFFAWAGLLMVLQQIIIVFMQRIFARPRYLLGLDRRSIRHQLVGRRAEALQRDRRLAVLSLTLSCKAATCGLI